MLCRILSILVVLVPAPVLALTFEVTNALPDAPNNSATVGSLGWAVNQANVNSGWDVIEFNIIGEIPAIYPVAEYLLTDDGTFIDGYTQFGATMNTRPAPEGLNTNLAVTVNGGSIGGGAGTPGYAVFRIEASYVTIRGLNVNEGPLYEIAICRSGNLGACMQNRIQGNFLGTDLAGTTAVPSGWLPWNPPLCVGVYMGSGSIGNYVGSDGDDSEEAAERNLISGEVSPDYDFAGFGILLDGARGEPPWNNVVAGNLIGTVPDIARPLPNQFGVAFLHGTQANRVHQNVISGNLTDGVFMITPPSMSANRLNTFTQNHIGIDPITDAALPNGANGMLLHNGSQENEIGTGIHADGNVISGNELSGIAIVTERDDSYGNVVAANFIGTDTAGLAAVPNGLNGVVTVNVVGGNMIGGGDQPNIISGNLGYGVLLTNSDDGDLESNWVGLNLDGGVVPNGLSGISLQCTDFSCSTSNSVDGNLVVGNQGNGIELIGPVMNNTVEWNTVELQKVAGIYTELADATNDLTLNTVEANAGGGIYLNGSSVSIEENQVLDNDFFGIYLSVWFGSDASMATAGDDQLSQPFIFNNTVNDNALGILSDDTQAANGLVLQVENTIGDNRGNLRVLQRWYGAVEILDSGFNPIGSGAYNVSLQSVDSAVWTGSTVDGDLWGDTGFLADDATTWFLTEGYYVDEVGVFHDRNPYAVDAFGPMAGDGSYTFNGSAGDPSLGGVDSGINTGGLYRYQVAEVVVTPCATDADCDDGVACNGAEVCDPTGAGCSPGVALDCSFLTDQCNLGVCSEVTGGCLALPLVDGTACDDGDWCTINDTCQAGSCEAGPDRDCSIVSNQCIVGVCNEVTDTCDQVPVVDGTACDDGLFCTDGDTCQAGSCAAGGPTDCSSAGDQCNDGVCNEATGSCVAVPLADGIECEDGAYCSVGDTCQSGFCVTGVERDCSSAADQCNTGACDEINDACVPVPAADGIMCDDGAWCTMGESCLAGECDPGPPRDCSSVADQCNSGACDEVNDACVAMPVTDGTACDDGLFCSDGDTCQSGACSAGPDRDCSASGDQCNQGVCDEDGAACVAQPVGDGTACEDGLYCSDADTCVAGTCTSGAERDCSSAADQCNSAACDEDDDECVGVPLADDTPCDDTDACTTGDACLAGACTGNLLDEDGDGYIAETCGGDDCDETNPNINPGAEEICGDLIDQDCNGSDLECTCPDADADGFEDLACGGSDCDDSDDSVYPGAAEVCGDEIDQDCDGEDTPCVCPDEDADGYQHESCGGTDCNDMDADIHPDADEICGDGIDQDCNGEDLECTCPDLDGDGFEDQACGGTDCNDSDAAVHPDAEEACGDSLDNNCDGLTDDEDAGCISGCDDLDGDGYLDDGCGGTDCDDDNGFINPGAVEICGDDIDQDCNGADLACVCDDADQDGYADVICGGADCDDGDASVHPGADEVCDDLVDNNCNGETDLDDSACADFCDADLDGYDNPACGGDDCDDGDPDSNPGLAEDCDDPADNDCDGLADAIDDDCAVACPDLDDDGYDDEFCGGDDCDDGDADVNPGATEICDDEVDNDCDGYLDSDDTDCPRTSTGCDCLVAESSQPRSTGSVLLILGLFGAILLTGRKHRS